MYDLGDRLLMVASDRISTYDAVHPTPIPGQGQGAHRAVGLLVRADSGTSSPTTCVSFTDGVPDEARGRALARAAAGDAARRVRRARLHHRLGLEGLPGDRLGLRHRAARRACASPSSCPSRSSRRARRPRSATTRRSTSSSAAELVGDRALMERVRDVSIALYSLRRRPRARARRDPRRHEVRVRPRRRRARASATRC